MWSTSSIRSCTYIYKWVYISHFPSQACHGAPASLKWIPLPCFVSQQLPGIQHFAGRSSPVTALPSVHNFLGPAKSPHDTYKANTSQVDAYSSAMNAAADAVAGGWFDYYIWIWWLCIVNIFLFSTHLAFTTVLSYGLLLALMKWDPNNFYFFWVCSVLCQRCLWAVFQSRYYFKWHFLITMCFVQKFYVIHEH